MTPISGVHSEDPLCYLLEVDDCRILLDCGWDERFEIRAWSNLVCARGARDIWPQSMLWKIAQRCA